MGNDLLFADEPLVPRAATPAGPPADAGEPWKILVVDDDPEVHAVTRLALGKVRFKNRRLALLSAFSATEAAAILRADPGIAMVLLDVVMETDDAGLHLVRTIREDIGNRAIRIILRTGQPGQAPEENVIVECDINDYKAKTELTTQKLFTTVIAALRAYSDITALETNRRGLQRIVESTDRLFGMRTLRAYASGVLTEVAAVLGMEPDGLLCSLRGGDRLAVLAGAGGFAGLVERPYDNRAIEPPVRECLIHSFHERRSVYRPDCLTLHIDVPDGSGMAVWMRTRRPLDPIDHGLVEVFASKIGLGFANVALYERLREANETLEARVAERTRALAEANGKLERLATLDVLTEVWNRRHFMELAAAEFARARRHGRLLSVFLIDLDHFKAVNDSYGHAAGDEALRTVVTCARDALRNSDLIARFGGEEFVVLLPETDLAGAAAVAERVRLAIAAKTFTFGPHTLTITASIGVAEREEGEPTVERTLMRADAALYDAKLAGRNRVVLAGSPPSDPG
ncbi:diguanylate cyclase [Azospirillum sp. RWY-5-1]|uniref:diguanylate cyclase n=1 Tax=Azospirillum oleiclasticum TaxID=2735135 RepID=A0ABX2TKB4_9PROT|nr:diguanylate cyclase [Azospirillum oleiclasticum]NYZ15933.1 diguanylate cyclase [Azospirillum oleiclasticum]NYZ23588.1 diguanylate cyclase [Azospirillum oleiclasticum]